MNTKNENSTGQKSEKPDLVKRIGNTTYKVKVHFNPDSKETLKQKIIRMLRNDVRQSTKL